MVLKALNSDLFVPDGAPDGVALSRTSHLAVGAHPDDLEIMAYSGIAHCYDSASEWFSGVVVTDGAGSSRSGEFAKLTDNEMIEVRKEEQRQAARIGKFSSVIQLGYKSTEVKSSARDTVRDDLREIFSQTRPRIVYLHNPADKHDTHVAVLMRSLEALRALPDSEKPEMVFGCEIWRDLDWVLDHEKSVLPASKHPELALKTLSVFASQIKGGKRYDTATLGRRHANATFFESHSVDSETALTFALNLTPLIHSHVEIKSFVSRYIEDFQRDVLDRLDRMK